MSSSLVVLGPPVLRFDALIVTIICSNDDDDFGDKTAPKKKKADKKETDFTVYADISEAIEAGVSKEDLLRYWRMEYSTANAVVAEAMGNLVRVWFELSVPHSVMLVNIKLLQRMVEDTMKMVTPPEQQEIFDQSMKEIDLIVDIIATAGKEKAENLWNIAKKNPKGFDPMVG